MTPVFPVFNFKTMVGGFRAKFMLFFWIIHFFFLLWCCDVWKHVQLQPVVDKYVFLRHVYNPRWCWQPDKAFIQCSRASGQKAGRSAFTHSFSGQLSPSNWCQEILSLTHCFLYITGQHIKHSLLGWADSLRRNGQVMWGKCASSLRVGMSPIRSLI